jgi:hypothetical protein
MARESKEPTKIYGKYISYILFSVTILTAFYSAYKLHWLCDDAFITFRYSLNLSKGLGPVYNSGEAVEGYTNFLWMILISSGISMGVSPERFSQGLGLLSFILNLVLLFFAGKKIQEIKIGKERIYVPLSMICFSVQYHARVYATSGLETSFFSFLLLFGILVLFFYRNQLSLWIGFTSLTLLCMTRPDGLLFYGLASLFYLVFRNNDSSFKSIVFKNLSIHIPFIIIYIPYFYWRYQFYGYLWPNTFYAKEAGSLYYQQGIKYIAMYFNSYYIFYFFFGLLLYFFISLYFKQFNINLYFTKDPKEKNGWLQKRKYRNFFKITEESSEINFKLNNYRLEIDWFFLALIPSFIYIFYLFLIGGDFMYARLLIPLSPLFFLGFEIYLYNFLGERAIRLVAFLFVLLTFNSIDPFKNQPFPEKNGITDENKIYKIKEVYKLKNKLIPHRNNFRELGVRISFGGTQAMMAYYLDPLVAIESVTGLTDKFIAHKKIKERGKVGHEKSADLEYLKKRKIHFHLFETNFSYIREYNKLETSISKYPWRIITYNQEILSRLESSGHFKYTNFNDYLNSYIKNIDSKNNKEFIIDYNEFNEYYFQSNENREKQAIFLGKIDSIKKNQEKGKTNE